MRILLDTHVLWRLFEGSEKSISEFNGYLKAKASYHPLWFIKE